MGYKSNEPEAQNSKDIAWEKRGMRGGSLSTRQKKPAAAGFKFYYVAAVVNPALSTCRSDLPIPVVQY